jgi:PleD family two-component response regulator
MPGAPNQRRGADRRGRPRGGRRSEDRTGYAPLVLLVDEDAANGERCEAILAKLHFAVAPTRSVEEALRVMTALRPEIVVARASDAGRLRAEAPEHVPVVPLEDDTGPEALVEAIRKAIRSQRSS